MPHLRDGFIVAKLGHRAKARPVLSDLSDFDRDRFVQEIVAEDRPWPVFGSRDEASGDWITVHVF